MKTLQIKDLFNKIKNTEQVQTLPALLKAFFKWTACACISGVVIGAIGALFHHLLSFAADFRQSNPWMLSPASCFRYHNRFFVQDIRCFCQKRNQPRNLIVKDKRKYSCQNVTSDYNCNHSHTYLR